VKWPGNEESPGSRVVVDNGLSKAKVAVQVSDEEDGIIRRSNEQQKNEGAVVSLKRQEA
jgi:hypothetical protein